MMVESIRLPDVPGALAELGELMTAAASGASPTREMATRYMLCRQAVLEGLPRIAIPGFVVQCGSISRFIEFITLYHWDAQMRLALVEQCFSAPEPRRSGPVARASSRGSVRSTDFFDDAAF